MVGTPGVGGTLGLSIVETDRQVITQMIQQCQQGHLNCTVQATLNANATSTTVTAATCTQNSCILASPLTADAAAVSNTLWFAPSSGQFVVNHASSATADKTFSFALIG